MFALLRAPQEKNRDHGWPRLSVGWFARIKARFQGENVSKFQRENDLEIL
jgi:hypothetical protein